MERQPCFKWVDGNQQLQLQYPGPAEAQQNWPNRSQDGPQHNSNWPGKNQEGQNNWGNRNQGDQPNWNTMNKSSRGSSYVPPHQRNATGNNQNLQHTHQGNQGSESQFSNNQGGQGNYRPNQGSGPGQRLALIPIEGVGSGSAHINRLHNSHDLFSRLFR